MGGIKLRKIFPNPLSTAGEERVDERSDVGVSRSSAMYLR